MYVSRATQLRYIALAQYSRREYRLVYRRFILKYCAAESVLSHNVMAGGKLRITVHKRKQ